MNSICGIQYLSMDKKLILIYSVYKIEKRIKCQKYFLLFPTEISFINISNDVILGLILGMQTLIII